MPVTDTVVTFVAEPPGVISEVHCTETIVEKSALPPEVPSAVGYIVACPLLPETATVPYHVPILTNATGAPEAAVE